MPLVSVILPVYNSEKYLSKCLDSLSAQTLRDIEVICVDDGSKDGSLRILREYAVKDGRIKVFSQKNAGAASARNKALTEAGGKYVMFCDSDDWVAPDFCGRMVRVLEQEKVDCVVCGAFIEDETGNGRNPDWEGNFELPFSGKKDVSAIQAAKTNVVLWNKIFKKELIDKYGIRFPDGRWGEDDCFVWQYLSVAESIFYLPEKLYYYLRRDGSMVSGMQRKNPLHLYDRFYTSVFYYEFLSQNGLFSQKKNFWFYFVLTECPSSVFDNYMGQEKKTVKELFFDRFDTKNKEFFLLRVILNRNFFFQLFGKKVLKSKIKYKEEKGKTFLLQKIYLLGMPVYKRKYILS